MAIESVEGQTCLQDAEVEKEPAENAEIN